MYFPSRRKAVWQNARLDPCEIKTETAPAGWHKSAPEYQSAYFYSSGLLATSFMSAQLHHHPALAVSHTHAEARPSTNNKHCMNTFMN